MSTNTHVILKNRGLIGVSGEDAVNFLQGLVSNDVTKVNAEHALYSALLTPQGKFLYDFFILRMEDQLLIDCEVERLDELTRKLTMYKLRSKAYLEDVSKDFTVAALFGDTLADSLGLENREGTAGSFLGGVAYIDPRLNQIGGRCVLPRENAETLLVDAGFARDNPENYEVARLQLGLPDGSRDLIVDKAILLENGFHELHGVDWDKGCYMGQELTARTHYRGLVKKRLMPVRIDGPLPAPGTPVTLDGKEAGEMRSGSGQQGLALIRLEQFETALQKDEGLIAGNAILYPTTPDWAEFKTEE